MDTQKDGPWKRWLLLNMSIFGIYLIFLGGNGALVRGSLRNIIQWNPHWDQTMQIWEAMLSPLLLRLHCWGWYFSPIYWDSLYETRVLSIGE